MKPFEAKVETIILRYYLLMAVVIIPFFIGLPLLALAALPIFIIAILGISFNSSEERKEVSRSTKSRTIVVPKYRNALNEAS